MINPFISIEQQLSDLGWRKYYENNHGFKFVKKIGIEVFYCAEFSKAHDGVRFYDDMIIGHDYDSIVVNEKDLELFAKKVKEWRKEYEYPKKAGRHAAKKRG